VRFSKQPLKTEQIDDPTGEEQRICKERRETAAKAPTLPRTRGFFTLVSSAWYESSPVVYDVTMACLAMMATGLPNSMKLSVVNCGIFLRRFPKEVHLELSDTVWREGVFQDLVVAR
jgi:hypothetical protein